MSSYALYRFPHEDTAHRIEQVKGEPEELAACGEIDGQQGFVMAPFVPSADQPVIIIRPDSMSCFDISHTNTPHTASHARTIDETSERQRYAIDFRNFHSQLLDGCFSKIVMARCSHMTAASDISPEQLFARACQLYPRMFVALVSAPRCGTWLMATPEILLRGGHDEWQTMALAGTMRLHGDALDFDTPNGRTTEADILWSMKNRFEQRDVADYIEECIEQFTPDFTSCGPYTVRAGDLVHLRTDFRFRIGDGTRIGDIINSLHPTPAVCGIPKRQTQEFIIDNESVPRHYYSGFAGPLNIDGQTSLYVSLRCMRIDGRDSYLYAGGGLLADSNEADEWSETQAKMDTMRQLLTY